LPYKSILTKSLTQEFSKLPRSVKEKLLDALKKAADSPYTGTELRGKTGGSMGIANWQIPRSLHDRRKREGNSLVGRGIEKIDIRLTFARQSTSAPLISMLVARACLTKACLGRFCFAFR